MNPRFSLTRALRFGAFGATVCGVSACNGCGSEKPYTPFGVASSLPSAAPAPSVTMTAGNTQHTSVPELASNANTARPVFRFNGTFISAAS